MALILPTRRDSCHNFTDRIIFLVNNVMRNSIFILLLFLQLFVIRIHCVQAGTTGGICGTVTDKVTGKAIAGATVALEEIPYRSMSDKNGEFALNQLPPGDYRLQVQMIGYKPVIIDEAKVKTDGRSRILILMSPDLGTPPKPRPLSDISSLFQTESPSVTRLFSTPEIRENFPIRSLNEITSLHPSSWKNHLRGGRNNEISTLVDGLPVTDLYENEQNLNIPVCAISEFALFSDGFDAEYGEAISGIVNIITHEGKNKSDAFIGLSSDNLAGLAKYYNTNTLEWNWNGPLVVSFGGPVIDLNYMLAGHVEFSDTPWRAEMSKSFESPISRNYSFIGKFNFHLSPQLSLGVQGIVNSRHWREFDYQWKYNLTGTPEFERKSNRYNILLKHEITPSFFYSLNYAYYGKEKLVLGEKSEAFTEIQHEEENMFDWVTDGNIQWWEETRQRVHLLKVDIVKNFSWLAQLKFGTELRHLEIRTKSTRFTEIPIFGDAENQGYIGEKNDFQFNPFLLASYIQANIRTSDVSANLGLRFDAFNANAKQPGIDVDIQNEKDITLPLKESTLQGQISPRLGMTFQLTEHDKLRFNYGWFFQIPSFVYFYQNLQTPLVGNFPLIGNPQLDYEFNILYELSYHHEINHHLKTMVSGFQKNLSNLTTTKIVWQNSSGQITDDTPHLAVAQLENDGRSTIHGLEFTLHYEPGSRLSTEIGYTLMKASGTAPTPLYTYYQYIWGIEQSSEDETVFDWDRRHSVFAMLNLRHDHHWGINLWTKLGSPLPYPQWGTNASPDQRFRNWQTYLAFRAYFSVHTFSGRLSPYIQIDNLLDNKIYTGYMPESLPSAFDMADPTLYEPSRRILVGINFQYD